MNKFLNTALFTCWLILMCGLISVSAQTSPLDKTAQEIKDKITKIGTGGDITIVDKSGREFYGTVLRIEDDLVAVSEVDVQKTVEINYREIKKVMKDYGTSRAWNGKRIRPKKHLTGLAIGAAAILIPIIVVVSSKD